MLATGHLNYQCKNLGGKQGEIAQGGAYYLTDSLVPGSLLWWVGVGNNQSIADYIFGCRKAINIGQKLATLGLKYTQLIRSHTTVHYQKHYKRLLAPHENKHPFWLLILKMGTGA